ncbi:hypothetical protein EF888_10645 [Silicimonas algicola]|uniref:Uncharacterized protein n=1 Tax=Silicimonas algicola TaxID=1826607 RepID=A0A316GCG7_9RHOB|nr:hypothetical protein [Silicimonas algicola]AZQ67549.1 hypothetical protein EF888_10645 [Silicimonas algicola]PWK57250.1 hypothetical protein C8D95_103489 [Silicimonas algicola]
MNGVAYRFFLTGAFAVVLGMSWGILMSISQDHTMAPAHAHLNLVGWASMGLFGLYYHSVPRAAATRLAQIHYLVALAGLVVMVPGIALAISEQGEAFAALGSILTMASMLIFVVTVARNTVPA